MNIRQKFKAAEVDAKLFYDAPRRHQSNNTDTKNEGKAIVHTSVLQLLSTVAIAMI